MKKRTIVKTPLVLALAAVGLVGAATASAAYFTGLITLQADVRALNVGIHYQEEALELDPSGMVPGDAKDLSFTVDNSGEISVDIKPVITLSADKEMKKSSSRFFLADAEGEEVSDFDVSYFDQDGNQLTNSQFDEDCPFQQVRYILSGQKTLAGSSQHEEEKGEKTSSESFEYQIRLSELTENSFAGAKAGIDVSTYAIQHRGRGEGGDNWIDEAVNISADS